jgi:nucleoside-diphosphate-sugar epimerase
MIEERIGKKAKIVHESSHPADMQATHANVTKAQNLLNWHPIIDVEQGIDFSTRWFTDNINWTQRIQM